MSMNLDSQAYAAVQHSGIPAHFEIDLPRSDLYLATRVYDLETGKAGTLEIPLHPINQAGSVGKREEDALVKVCSKLYSYTDHFPPGARSRWSNSAHRRCADSHVDMVGE